MSESAWPAGGGPPRPPRGVPGALPPDPPGVGVTPAVWLPEAEDTPCTAVSKPPSLLIANTEASNTATATTAAAGPDHTRALIRRGTEAAIPGSGKPSSSKPSTLDATNSRYPTSSGSRKHVTTRSRMPCGGSDPGSRSYTLVADTLRGREREQAWQDLGW